ncbi:MAG: hypothetical protein WD942_06390 [Dehalococcoidia bacterium]
MELVGAFACSHAGLIVERRDQAPEGQHDAVYGSFETVRQEIEQLEPDALIVLATDHMKAWPLQGVPQFSLGVGPTARGLGDGGMEPCRIPVHQVFAQSLLEQMVASGVDLAFSEDVAIDHSFVTPLSLLTPNFDVPIVPMTQNCNVPPRPTFARSREVGAWLGEAIQHGPKGRVVLVGTGGLSHWVGSQRRQDFMRRPAGTRLADLKDHPVEISDDGPINASWDRDFLRYVEEGRLSEVADAWSPDDVEEAAGNGAQEIRQWLTVAAAAGDPPAKTLAYEPVAAWLTGTAVVRFEVTNDA